MQKGFNPMGEIYFSLCKEFNTPVSLGCWLRYKYDESQLLQVDFDPRNYTEYDLDKLKKDLCVTSFLSKWRDLDTGVDCKAVALQKFATSEQVCRESNMRLRSSRSAPIDADLSSRLFRAKIKIAKLLGPFSLHAISPYFGWGPGATFDLKRARAQIDRKLTTIPLTVCGTAVELFSSVIRQDLHWSGALLGNLPEGEFDFTSDTFQRVDMCRVDTVPKSAKTDRVIAVEPTGNLFLQKGVGGYFRKVLKRRGIDLDNQGANQRGAAEALQRSLATLDLSAASDTVCKELVYELLPYDWASFMDAIRSKKALMPDGSEVVLEKWSSMGNGYTFELETLIFWALGSSVCEEKGLEGDLLVYGDDIICHSTCYQPLVETLNFVGFAVNKEKSFADGLFYESCGEHYFNGVEVTPMYQKKALSDVELVRLHNRVVRWSERVGVPTNAHMPCYRLVRESGVRDCLIPLGVEGDDGFLVPVDVLLAHRTAVNRSLGFRCKVLRFRPRSLPGHERALLAVDLRFRRERSFEALGFFDLALESPEATYGDISLPPEKTGPEIGGYTHRWVNPPGYCFLPIRQ